jgi:type I restriction enzyme M protein
VLKKCRQKNDPILFIDASGEDRFEKVKNQNVLRDEDVDLIVETYRERKVIDKFSYAR